MIDPMSRVDTEASHLLSELERLEHASDECNAFNAWLSAWSRVKCEIQTLWATHLLATVRDTDDQLSKAQYEHFMERWVPKFDVADQPLARLALAQGIMDSRPGIAAQIKAELGEQQGEQLSTLMAREQVLGGQYDTITSARRVEHGGRPLIPREAQAKLETTSDPSERTALWLAMKESELATATDLDALFLQLLQVRQDLAIQAGSAHYADYVWQRSNREYTLQDAVNLLDDISEEFADLTTWVDKARADHLNKTTLGPWDLTVNLDPNADGHLTSRFDEEEYIIKTQQMFEILDPEFSRIVGKLKNEGYLDLFLRSGKAEGNWTTHLYASGTSDVMCNLSGSIEGFKPLMHELGHAIHCHYLSANPDNLVWDFYNGMEAREFYAYVFEFLAGLHLLDDPIISSEERIWYKRLMLEDVLSRFRDVNERMRLEFWLYQQNHKVGIEEIDAHYLNLYRRPGVDWSGHEDYLRKQWQESHLFLFSFYSIEYSIATVAALLFVQSYLANPSEGLTRLKRTMSMGASAGTAAVLAEAGIQFPFSREQLGLARNFLSEWLT